MCDPSLSSLVCQIRYCSRAGTLIGISMKLSPCFFAKVSEQSKHKSLKDKFQRNINELEFLIKK